MPIPKLKRVKVSTIEELQIWLEKNAGSAQEVMIVTSAKKSSNAHIRSETIRNVLGEHGWTAGASYTLSGDLYGHVARVV